MKKHYSHSIKSNESVRLFVNDALYAFLFWMLILLTIFFWSMDWNCKHLYEHLTVGSRKLEEKAIIVFVHLW